MASTHIAHGLSGTDKGISVDWGRIERALAELNSGPPGSFTVQQYATETGTNKSVAIKRLYKLVDAGVLKRTPPANGKTAYFWFKDNE